MPSIPVYVSVLLVDPEARDEILERLDDFQAVDATFDKETDDGPSLTIDAADGFTALARGAQIVRGALDGTDLDESKVSLSVGDGWV